MASSAREYNLSASSELVVTRACLPFAPVAPRVECEKTNQTIEIRAAIDSPTAIRTNGDADVRTDEGINGAMTPASEDWRHHASSSDLNAYGVGRCPR